MPIVDSELAPLHDPRLAALATGAWPVWLWSVDGSRILWANAVGAAIFSAANVGALGQRRFKPSDTAAAQVIRLGATLPSRAQERLERLRGFGAGFGRALTCVCSRIVLDDGRAAVLIVAGEAAGPALTLGERVRRLFSDGETAIAAFGADGVLVYTNATALTRLAGARTLSALGLADLAVPATGSGQTSAQIGGVAMNVVAEHLGKDNTHVLLLTLVPQAMSQAETWPAEPVAETMETLAQTIEPAFSVPDAPAVEAAPPIETAAAPTPVSPVETQDFSPAGTEEPAAAPVPVPQIEAPIAAELVSAPAAHHHAPLAERRHPLRFVWHMDADERFVVGSDEFVALVGPRTMAAVGRHWSDIAGELDLDPDNHVARAIATHDTWSGIVLSWPVDDSSERLPVELSGLPVFDRDRVFRGYRGFGVCRDVDRINALVRERRERPAEILPAPQAPPPQAPPPDIEAPARPAVMAQAADEIVATAEPEAVQPEATEPEAVEPEAAEPEPIDIVPGAANVVPFRQAQSSDTKTDARTPPPLSPIERRAFRELAQELTARLRGSGAAAEIDGEIEPTEAFEAAAASEAPGFEWPLLDRIPIGILLYRHDSLLYANRHFLEWSGYESLDAIEASGGLHRLFAGPAAASAPDGGVQTFSIRAASGYDLPAEGRMFTVPWQGSSAFALVLTSGQAEAALKQMERALAAVESENREIKSILDTLPDGVVTLDRQGVIASANARAAALFGRTADALAGCSLGELLAPESARVAREYLERAANGGGNGNDNAIEVAARLSESRLMPLALTLAHIGKDRFVALLHDTTARRQGEDELRNAKREATKAVAAKNEFLVKVNHEIRTPLNAITGFAEVILAERFGPIGNERYSEYIKDIHAAGAHLVTMLNDLVDLSRIESGRAELNFANISLNALTQQCVGIMQPQANKARIIIRTALTPALPNVVADERSMRQIVLNLLSNSIRLTGPGGQVIVSTVFSDAHEAVLRVRDTGAGMSEQDIQAAMEPFQQTATSGSFDSSGAGFGLPLTKAIAEANRANFSITSAPNAGTLVEIAFPPSRVVAE
jgi:PAS domain S-box-containing protein